MRLQSASFNDNETVYTSLHTRLHSPCDFFIYGMI